MQEKITKLLTDASKMIAENDIHGAIGCYKRVVEMDPQHKDAYFELGSLYNMLGELSSALSSFCCVIDIDPNHREARVNVDMINSILNFYHKDRYNP